MKQLIWPSLWTICFESIAENNFVVDSILIALNFNLAYEYVPDSEMTSMTIGSQEDLLDKVS